MTKEELLAGINALYENYKCSDVSYQQSQSTDTSRTFDLIIAYIEDNL